MFQKFPVFFVLFVCSQAFLSCTKDEETPPEMPLLELVKGNGLVFKDTVLAISSKFNVKIKASKGNTALLDALILTVNGTIQAGYPRKLQGAEKESFEFTLELNTPNTTGTTIYAFLLKDEQNNTNLLQLTIDAQQFTVLKRLQQGGYVLYFRHMAANVGSDITTAPGEWWKSCDAKIARQLNDQGRSDATMVGKMMAEKQVKISRIISSEFCRCFESAELLRNELSNKSNLTLEYSKFLTYLQPQFNTRGPLDLITAPPATGTNTILMSHLLLSDSASQIPQGNQLEWGDALMFQPDGMGGWKLIGFIRIGEWKTMQ